MEVWEERDTGVCGEVSASHSLQMVLNLTWTSRATLHCGKQGIFYRTGLQNHKCSSSFLFCNSPTAPDFYLFFFIYISGFRF